MELTSQAPRGGSSKKLKKKRLQAAERASLKAERKERQRRATAQLRELIDAAINSTASPDYAELGRFLEISHQSVYKFMTAKNAQPSLGLITAIWKKFDIDFRLLLELASPENREQFAKLKLPSVPHALKTNREKQAQCIAKLERLIHQIPGPLQNRFRLQVEQVRDTYQQSISLINNMVHSPDEEEREFFSINGAIYLEPIVNFSKSFLLAIKTSNLSTPNRQLPKPPILLDPGLSLRVRYG